MNTNMKTNAYIHKTCEVLAQVWRAIDNSISQLPAELSLGFALMSGRLRSKSLQPKRSTRLGRRNALFTTGLVALACALLGVGSALADGRVTVTAATGGEAIPATTANGAWTTLNGPVLTEGDPSSITGNGTIVLTVPNGFELNPDVSVTVLVGNGSGPQNINGVPDGGTIPVTVTSTTLTLNVSSRSGASPADGTTLTFQNIQVRPTASSPLANGNLTESGTCGLRNLTLASGTWGFLREVGGSVVAYQITGSNYTTAGSPISITIQKIDQFGNPASDSTAETLSFSGCGTVGTHAPTINGSPDAFTTGIPVTFDGSGSATLTLVDYLAETATVNVTDGTASSTIGLAITVAAGPASTFVFDNPPSSVTYGSTFGVGVQSTDQYGNPSTTGLGSSVNVTLTLGGGAATLSGTLTQDIGTSAGNGTAIFTGLQITAAGNGDVLSAGANGFTPGTTTIDVLPLVIGPTVVVGTKTYDGTTDAPIIGRSLAGVLGGDDVSLGQSGVAAFADKHVGTAKQVTVTGLRLTGSVAANYQLSTTSMSAAADITPRPVTVEPTPQPKTYDGTTHSAALPTISSGSLARGDTCALSQQFGDKKAGKGKLLIPSGSINDGNSGNNYTVTFLAATNGIIEPTPITVTAAPDSKPYDGTTVSAAMPTITSGSLVSPDTAAWTQAFGNKTAGTGKTLIPAGLVADGNGGSNYAVTFVNNLDGLISAKAMAVTGITASDKVYDGTVTTTLNTSGAALVGLAPLDVVNLDTTGATGAFTDPNVGTGKTVLVSGLTIAGADAGNYTLTQPATTANITQAGLTVTGIEAQSKIYDGTNSATLIVSNAVLAGVLAGDTVTLNTTNAAGAFEDKNVGPGKLVQVSGLAISGADMGNYTLTQPVAQATISPATVTPSVTVAGKVYDGTTAATITGRSVSGVMGTDDVNLGASGTAAFGDKSAGPGKLVNISDLSLSGSAAGNYVLSATTAAADITPRALTVIATGVDKLYDGTTAATVTLSDDRLAGDSLAVSYATAVFTDASAGLNKRVQVTGISLAGNDAGNYSASAFATTTTSINQAALSVAAGNFSRTYGAANPAFTGTLTGVLAGDDITATYSTDAQPSSPAGNYSIVPALSDPDNRLANYSVKVNNGTLTVTSANSTVALSSSQNPSVEGSGVGLTAAVSPVATGSSTPTGGVQFYANGQPLGDPIAMTDGAATLNTTQLSAGSNTISAVYSGDANFLGSTSGSLIQAVQMDIRTVTILSIVPNGDGTATITCQGVPATVYWVQATPALKPPITWETVSSNTSGFIDGKWTYVDDMTQHPQRFFRAVLP